MPIGLLSGHSSLVTRHLPLLWGTITLSRTMHAPSAAFVAVPSLCSESLVAAAARVERGRVHPHYPGWPRLPGPVRGGRRLPAPGGTAQQSLRSRRHPQPLLLGEVSSLPSHHRILAGVAVFSGMGLGHSAGAERMGH